MASKISGRHTTLDHETKRSVDWLAGRPEVKKILLGPHAANAHTKTPGSLRFRKYEHNVATVIAYTGVGVRNIYVHTMEPEAVQRLLEERFDKQMPRPRTVMADALARALPVAPPKPHRRDLPPQFASNVVPEFTPAVAQAAPAPAAAPVVIDSTPGPAIDPFTLSALQSIEGLTIALVMITPEMAGEWTRTVEPARQRNLKTGVVESYEATMKDGRWGVSDTVYAFDKNGCMINGQHRSWAIVQSGATVPGIVVRGFPSEAIAYFDSGSGRRVDEAYKITFGTAITKLSTGIARKLAGVGYKGNRGNVPRERVFDMVNKIPDGIAFIQQHLSRSGSVKGVGTVGVATVILRAFYALPESKRARLVQFCDVLRTGMSLDGADDSAAILLRNWLQKNPTYSAPVSEEAYWRTQRAVDAFIKREPLQALSKSKRELFPLPWDAADPS